MTLRVVSAADIARRLSDFDQIIDVRSPSEFAEDRLPGAVNWPVLDDDERARVGSLYKQVSPHEARKAGAGIVARNIAAHLDAFVHDKPRGWQPLVYCWRGGQRSGSLAWFLGQIGFRTHQLAGGYKAFRAVVREELQALPQRFEWLVLAGRTGSGKTRLLKALAAEGAQTLDLEALACHRGSVLGGLPDQPQPSQKRFDTLVWHAMSVLDPGRLVFVESESRKIGRLQVPEALLEQMRERARCVRVEMPDDARVQLLLEDYGFFAQDPERLCGLLDALVELRGRETVRAWQALARAGRWAELFGDLMQRHYDPLYDRSMHSNFEHMADASTVMLARADEAALSAAARELLCEEARGEAAQTSAASAR
jgi:tRNA 2-selenouridine synthase